jgi:hypothetical protein
MTHDPAHFQLTIKLGDFVTTDSVGSNQCHETDAARNHPLRVTSLKMQRRRPNRLLIVQNIFKEVTFE